MPNQPLAMHHHDHPRVIIALTGGTMNIVDPSGNVEASHMGDGQSLLAPRHGPNALHSDINTGEKPMEVMVVELENEK